MKFKSLFLALLLLCSFQLFAQGEDVEASTLTTSLIYSVVGAIFFYLSDLIQFLKDATQFNAAYWWKDNRLSLIVNILAAPVVVLLHFFNPSILNMLFGMVGIDLIGMVGTAAFHFALATIIDKMIIGKIQGGGITAT